MSTFGNVFELSSLNGTNGFRISSEGTSHYSGAYVASAGDVNGDGFDDLIIGGYGANVSYVVFGKASGFVSDLNLSTLDGTNGFQITGDGGRFGRSVASAGDVNGDGFDDVIIGAFLRNRAGGSSYVVFGQEGGFGANLNAEDLDGTNGFRIRGVNDADYSGTSVASAGDVNGDGFDDVIIGATGVDNAGATFVGASYVVFGKLDGFTAELSLGALNGADGFRIIGQAAADFLGSSVASAGDVNNDGFDDLIVGAILADPNGNYSGSTYVVFGKGAENPFGATVDLTTLDGTNGFKINGLVADSLLGRSVASAGDVNGDGFDDLIIGANGIATSYVVFGKSTGFAATVNLTTLDGTNGFTVVGPSSGFTFAYSVASAGDVNGDGFDDLIIGARNGDGTGDNSSPYAGVSYVVFGKSGGFDATVDVTTMTSAEGFRINGAAAGDASGRTVAAAGDLNNDGFDDLIIGSREAGNLAGASWVIFGKATSGTAGNDILDASGLDDTLDGQAGDDIIRGNGGIDTLIGGADNDQIFGGTESDTLVGDAGRDLLEGGAGNDSLFGGAGNDTFVIDSQFDTLSDASGTDEVRTGAFSVNLTNAAFSGIENAGLTGSGNFGLTGTATANALTGNDGNNLLSGGGGADRLIGGAGNDTYVIDGGDSITEAVGAGTDTVQSSIGHTLGANVERLILTGTAAINGTGNVLANTLTGNSGANLLNGGGGADRLIGGAGNDTYVTDGGDTLTEGLGAGTDSVQSSVSLTLGANLENLTLTGVAAINGTGNALVNMLIGNGAANRLSGGEGSDRMTGGLGDDSFIFNTTLGPANVDRITDYNATADTIRLEGAIFTGIGNGAVSSAEFFASLTGNAADASDRILYDTDSGKVFFDSDGNGAVAKVLFATVAPGLALTSADFLVF